MLQSFEHVGRWWLADEPNEPLSGTLTFSQDEGLRLSLVGLFGELQQAMALEQPTVVINGIAENRPMTLLECILTNSGIGSEGVHTSEYAARFAFSGAHFASADAVRLKQLRARYTDLEMWSGTTGVKLEISEPRDFVAHVRVPESLAGGVWGDWDIALEFEHAVQYPRPGHPLQISESAWFSVSSETPEAFDDMRKLLEHIQDFLTIAMSRPVVPVTLTCTTEEVVHELPDGRIVYEQIDVFYRIRGVPTSRVDARPNTFLFMLSDTNGRLAELLNRWLQSYELLEPVYDLYTGLVTSKGIFLETQFLLYAQAIEADHRRKYPEELNEPSDQFARRVEAIIEAVRESDRELVSEALRYANEPRLRSRLNRLSKSIATVLDVPRRRRDSFLSKVVATRNYYTHFDSEGRASAATGIDLYRINQRLRIWLEILMMAEMGFDVNELRRLCGRNDRVRRHETVRQPE